MGASSTTPCVVTPPWRLTCKCSLFRKNRTVRGRPSPYRPARDPGSSFSAPVALRRVGLSLSLSRLLFYFPPWPRVPICLWVSPAHGFTNLSCRLADRCTTIISRRRRRALCGPRLMWPHASSNRWSRNAPMTPPLRFPPLLCAHPPQTAPTRRHATETVRWVVTGVRPSPCRPQPLPAHAWLRWRWLPNRRLPWGPLLAKSWPTC
jgi:hypothetical protein